MLFQRPISLIGGFVLLVYFGPQKFFEAKEWWSKELSDGWWRNLPMELMQWDTFFIGLGALGVLYGTSSLWLTPFLKQKMQHSSVNIPLNNPNNSIHAQGRVFIKKSAKEIFADLKNLVTIKEEERAKFYIGKWLRVQGTVDDISQYGDKVTIRFSSEWFFSFRSVNMEFTNEQTCAFLKTMNQGQRLAVIGEITDASSLTIDLKDCELLDEFAPKDDKLK